MLHYVYIACLVSYKSSVFRRKYVRVIFFLCCDITELIKSTALYFLTLLPIQSIYMHIYKYLLHFHKLSVVTWSAKNLLVAALYAMYLYRFQCNAMSNVSVYIYIAVLVWSCGFISKHCCLIFVPVYEIIGSSSHENACINFLGVKAVYIGI